MAETRRDVAHKLLKLTHGIAADLGLIEGCKETLRAMATEAEAGFTEDFGDDGEVAVSSPTEKKFKGLVPELNADAFLDLSEVRRKKLETDGIVTMVREYTKASKPSVTVRM